ncbi:dephospho-CoA kinase [Vagococcus elongatus]|uniref:Dephospho-CoA kinase n=1 Tax=Vagococcus elongatus TaxID=180344 RepID=A0A430AXA6_9ENTE|nr:dephospho-CoA kinase [Vagococcus elongatus]RSU12688.1 dephospho-CoA kinase [Vagococcus elongatus]
MTFVLGITGGIATGKSTADKFFSERNIPLIDADIIAREVVEPGTAGLSKIAVEFGKEILTEEGRLNRKKLGSIVFNDKKKLERLNYLLKEELFHAIGEKIKEAEKKKPLLIVVDVPLMYEENYHQLMDAVMVIYVPERIQLKRLMERDGLNEEAAGQRIKSQMPIEEKKHLADIVIDNSYSVENTYRQLESWLQEHFPEVWKGN